MTAIPVSGEYRGVPLCRGQNEARLAIVREQIDRVLDTTSVTALFDIVCSRRWSVEARLLSAQKIEQVWDLAVEERRQRPDIDLPTVGAWIAECESEQWARIFGIWPPPDNDELGAVRERPLPDDAD